MIPTNNLYNLQEGHKQVGRVQTKVFKILPFHKKKSSQEDQRDLNFLARVFKIPRGFDKVKLKKNKIKQKSLPYL